MRTLILTNIFANSVTPTWGRFNVQQFRALAELCDVDILATIPWFPGARFVGAESLAKRWLKVPRQEIIAGMTVHHPRYAYLPKVGYPIAGLLYAASLLPELSRRRGQFDVLMGSWAYPDGFAAALLARWFGVPAVIKLHGSDINVLAEMKSIRGPLSWGLSQADAVVAVSRPLAEKSIALGARRERVVMVPNGVDSERFRPRPKKAARQAVGEPHEGPLVVYVGRIEKAKGLGELVESFSSVLRDIPNAKLALVGAGSYSEELAEKAKSYQGRVRLVGVVPHEQVAQWMNAADLFTLPSWAEGTPNVVLEALASGTPVVATNVGGIPDVVDDPILGELVPPKSPGKLAGALVRQLQTPERACADIVEKSPTLPWDESAGRLLEALRGARNRQGLG